MPTCIALTSLVALNLLKPMVGESSGYWLYGLGAMNLLTAYGLGIFDQKLSGPMPPPDDAFSHPAWAFVLLQFFLVPSLLLLGYLMLAIIVPMTE